MTNRFIWKYLTYDDVLLLPAYSEILPREVQTQTKLTQKISLSVPFLSAAMDTVTESEMAIAMAREWWIGIIHKNITIEQQIAMVKRVKRSESWMITDPIVLQPNMTIENALDVFRKNSIGGCPVVDENYKLVGILTNRDLYFEDILSKKVSEVMTSHNLITIDHQVNLAEAKKYFQKYKIEKLPIVDKEWKLKWLITLKDFKKAKEFPNSSKDELWRLMVGAALWVWAETMDRVSGLVDVGVDIVVVDSAHWHSKWVLDTISSIKKKYPDLQIIWWNIATSDWAKALIDAGADAIKVWIWPGSICTTRIVAGVGVPQFSAIHSVAEWIKNSGIPIIADWWIKQTGDVVKALVAGASTVMLGSLLAGTEEAPWEVILLNGRKFKSYRWMWSLDAMQKGSADRYGQDKSTETKKLVPEWIVGRVAYKWTVSEVMFQYVWWLKSGMWYCGAKEIQKLWETKFIEITGAGLKESHPHDVTITKESPNYKVSG